MTISIRAAGLAAAAGGLALAAAGSALAEADITGAWGRYFAGPNQTVDSKLLPPPAGEPPLRPEPKAAYEAHRKLAREADERGEPLASNSVACLPDGMPQMMFAIYPLEILQTKGQVTIIEEAYSQVRHIYLDKPQAKLEDVPPGYFGRSVGRWEGDVLVVDTIGIKESVPVGRDVPHSAEMRITERLQLAGPGVLHDEITITDPKLLERPWTFTYAYRKLPGYEMLEYVCEDNREYVDEKGGTHLRLEGSKPQ